MMHRMALKAMDRNYPYFAYCKLFNQMISAVVKQVHPNLDLRKDAVLVLNAMLMDTMDTLISGMNTSSFEWYKGCLVAFLLEIGIHGQLAENASTESFITYNKF